MPQSDASTGHLRGRTLLFLTIFSALVLLSPARADQTQPTGPAASDVAQADATAQDSTQELIPSPPPPPDSDYGASTAISGNTVVVGSPGDSAGQGSATVFQIGADGTAAQVGTIAPPSPDQSGFGSALSMDGQTLAVGAPGSSDHEAVDLFDPATQALLAQLLGASEVGPGARFGSAVAVFGDWLAVGAPAYVDGGSGNGGEGGWDGAVVIYLRQAGVWGTSAYQTLYGFDYSTPGSEFGSALDMDGTTLVVGAPRDVVDGEGPTAGAVHVFQLFSGEGDYWDEAMAPLTDPDAYSGEDFGRAVAVDNGTIVAGAPSGSVEGPGRVVIFGDLTAPDGPSTQTIDGPSDGFLFGRSLALDGGNLAVGYVQGSGDGAVDLFSQGSAASNALRLAPRAVPPGFTQQGTLTGTGFGYGQSLAASGGHLVLGGGGHAYLAGAGSSGGGGGGTGGGTGAAPGGPPAGSPASGGKRGGGGSRGSAHPSRLGGAPGTAPGTVILLPHADKPEAEDATEEHAGEGEAAGTHGEEADRSSFADSVLSPVEVDLSFTNLAEGGIIAFILAALLYLPVTIFNKATEKNHEEITGWLAGPRRRMEAAADAVPFARHPLALLISTGVVGGLLFSFVEPGFPSEPGALQYLMGMVLGLVVVAVVFFVTWRAVVHRLEPESEGRWRLYPPYMLLAVFLILLARLAHFLPGVVLGTLAEYEPGKQLSRRTAGLRVLVTYGVLLVIGGAAWFAWIPVEHAAKEPGASSLMLILDSFLAVIFVTALESTIFGLLPLKFLDGDDLFRWSKGLWLLVWGVGVYWFSVVILHPALSTYNEVSGAGVFWFGLLFGSLMIIALSTWAVLAIRNARATSAAS